MKQTATNQCTNCGKANAVESRYCRYCGYEMPDLYFQPADPMANRRPYSWQTDEFQTKSSRRNPRATVEEYPAAYRPAPGAQPLVRQPPQYMAGNYRCPNCGTGTLPVVHRRISPGGWLTFTLLLVFTFIFFWVGLLMKEDVHICPVCGFRLN